MEQEKENIFTCPEEFHQNREIEYILLDSSNFDNSRFMCCQCLLSTKLKKDSQIAIKIKDILQNNITQSGIYNWPPLFGSLQKLQTFMNRNNLDQLNVNSYQRNIREFMDKVREQIFEDLQKLEKNLLLTAENLIEKKQQNLTSITQNLNNIYNLEGLKEIIQKRNSSIEDSSQLFLNNYSLFSFMKTSTIKYDEHKEGLKNIIQNWNQNNQKLGKFEQQLKKFSSEFSLKDLTINEWNVHVPLKEFNQVNKYLPFERFKYRNYQDTIHLLESENIRQQIQFYPSNYYKIVYSQAFDRDEDVVFQFKLTGDQNFSERHNQITFIVTKDGDHGEIMGDKFFFTGNEIIFGTKDMQQHSKHNCNYSDRYFNEFFDGSMDMVVDINIEDNKFFIQDKQGNFWVQNLYQFEEGEKWRFLVCKCDSWGTYFQLDFI